MAVLASAALPSRAADAPALSPPFAREARLAAGHDARYRVAVAAGHSVDLSMQQMDATLKLRVSGGGSTWPLMQNDGGRQALTRVTLNADHATVWTIEVAAANAKRPATFRLTAGSPHPTQAADRLRTKAEQALATAETLRREAGSLEHGKRAGASTPAQVLSSYQLAIDAARAAGDDCLQLMANSDRARYEFAIGQYAQSRDSEIAALKFRCGPASDLAAAVEEAAAQRTLGAAAGYLGDFTAAIAAQERALALYRQTGDTNFQAMVLGNLSADYRVTGATHKAMAAAKASLALAQHNGDRQRALFARENMAAILMQRGEWGKARQAYLAVLDALRASPYPLVEGMTLTDLGQVDWELHDAEQSRRDFAQAETLAKQAGDSQGLADTRLDEADNDLEDHRADAAEAIYRDNLGVDVKLHLQREQVHALTGLGRVAIARHDWSEAKKNLIAARELAHTIKAVELETMVDQALGDLNAAQHLAPQAAAVYARGYALAVRDHDDNSRIILLGDQARLALAAGDAQAADKFIAPAIALIESEQAQIDAPSLRTHYFASLRAYYGLYVDILMRLDRDHPGKGYAVEALQVSEQARARSLRDQLLARGIDVGSRAAPNLIAAEQAAEDNLRQAAWRQGQLPADATAAARQMARHDIDVASRRLDDARGQLRAADPRYAELAYPRPFDLARFQQRMLDAGDVVFEYWLGPTHSYRWRITQDTVTASVLPSRSVLDAAASALRASILAPGAVATASSFAARSRALVAADQRAREQAAALGKLLLPAAGGSDRQTRIIVADGELQRIPFDLLDPDSRHDYVYLPSLATLAELRANHPAHRDRPSLAVFADPVFNIDDPRLAHRAEPAGTTPLADSTLRDATADIGIATLSRLPYSHIEASDIAALLPANARWVATGFAASRANALATDWSRYSLVHFATHSLIDLRHPELSGVVLSLYNAKGQRQDGVLRMQDIYNLHMPVDLVTLSVCDSTSEPSLGAEGIFGLSRAFFYAGVRRLVVSLWPVDDRASAKLMTLFYTHLIDRRQSPQAALQAAQAQMRSDPRWRSPYYWAGFVVQGDWR